MLSSGIEMTNMFRCPQCGAENYVLVSAASYVCTRCGAHISLSDVELAAQIAFQADVNLVDQVHNDKAKE